jgi:hypothetical protein
MATLPVTPTWDVEEMPVLLAIRQAELEGKVPCGLEDLLGRDGVSRDTLPLIVDRLYRGGFVEARTHVTSPVVHPPMYDGLQLSALARSTIGQWPSAVDDSRALLAVILQLLGTEPNPDKKRKLQRLFDAASDIPADVISSVISGVLRAHGVPST